MKNGKLPLSVDNSVSDLHDIIMKHKLNPNLVRFWAGPSHDEHWVFLKNPVVHGDCKSAGIGRIEIEEIPEAEGDRKALKLQNKETELALSAHAAHAGFQPAADPHIILTKDCLGFKGPVRLLIYSDQPFV
ncbi:MAG TPA: hypothetical protein VHG71_03750 [Verrucomicrobiae bacterium]|nr:hypothetical protein [Verrucomicrobiae bacterium]